MEENCVKQTEYNLYYYEILIEGVTIQFTWINRQKAIKKQQQCHESISFK